MFVCERTGASASSVSHLWSRVPGDQTGQLEGLSFTDGVHPLRVALLLDIARVAGVHNADSRGSCGGTKRKPWGSGTCPSKWGMRNYGRVQTGSE